MFTPKSSLINYNRMWRKHAHIISMPHPHQMDMGSESTAFKTSFESFCILFYEHASWIPSDQTHTGTFWRGKEEEGERTMGMGRKRGRTPPPSFPLPLLCTLNIAMHALITIKHNYMNTDLTIQKFTQLFFSLQNKSSIHHYYPKSTLKPDMQILEARPKPEI